MSLTTDPHDPRLGHGTDSEPQAQSEAYLVLPEAERAKGFVRPLRLSYRHVGTPGPAYPLREITEGDLIRYSPSGCVKYEEYPPAARTLGRFGRTLGRYWSQAQLDAVGKGCGNVTTMDRAVAETYARQPVGFYGSTYCCVCMRHRPVGPQGEFTWVEADGSEAGNRVGT